MSSNNKPHKKAGMEGWESYKQRRKKREKESIKKETKKLIEDSIKTIQDPLYDSMENIILDTWHEDDLDDS